MDHISQAQEGHQNFVERERDVKGGADENTSFFRTIKSRFISEKDLIDLHIQEAKEKEEIYQS